MKKTVLTFGSIAGIIVSAMFFITMPLYKSGIVNFDNGELIGYTSMVIALSLIFFGIKSYRDNRLNGAIKFGKAFQVGLLIALIASLFYAVGWEVYFNVFAPDFMDQYANHYVAKVKAAGASPAEIQKIVNDMNNSKELYKNPFLRFGMTLSEILPVGLVIALISAAILRKKEILPA
jgi:hypothetical protein